MSESDDARVLTADQLRSKLDSLKQEILADWQDLYLVKAARSLKYILNRRHYLQKIITLLERDNAHTNSMLDYAKHVFNLNDDYALQVKDISNSSAKPLPLKFGVLHGTSNVNSNPYKVSSL